jgi:hypothetical protein
MKWLDVDNEMVKIMSNYMHNLTWNIGQRLKKNTCKSRYSSRKNTTCRKIDNIYLQHYNSNMHPIICTILCRTLNPVFQTRPALNSPCNQTVGLKLCTVQPVIKRSLVKRTCMNDKQNVIFASYQVLCCRL